MTKNTADLLVEHIIDSGIDTVFGMPGEGITGIMEAIRLKQSEVRFIQVRQEESAAFMACAYAKYTGKLGCCLASSGPAAINLLNGLYDAKLDHAPVLVITGRASTQRGRSPEHEINMTKLFSDLSCYNEELINPEQIETLAAEACRQALVLRGVAHLSIPLEHQTAKVDLFPAPPKKIAERSWQAEAPLPAELLLTEAAELLNQARRPVILIGQGARHAVAELCELAEKLGAPILKTLLGKDVIADNHPLATGCLGLLGTRPSQEAVEECDLILLVGTSFPYENFLPAPQQAKSIQIDNKKEQLGRHFPVDLGLLGDAKATLAAILDQVEYKPDRFFIEKIQGKVRQWNELMKSRLDTKSIPIKPQLVMKMLSELAKADAIISGDTGSSLTWFARHFDMKSSQRFSCSGAHGTMAPALPYAIAASLAFPGRQSIGFVGDGAFTMLMGEFVTAIKYKLPITIVVFKNNVFAQSKWEQVLFHGTHEFGVELQSIDFAGFAEACGGVGFSVKDPAQLKLTLEAALTCNKASIVEVYVDPDEAPVPPKLDFSQATHIVEALARGEADAEKLAGTLFKEQLSRWF